MSMQMMQQAAFLQIFSLGGGISSRTFAVYVNFDISLGIFYFLLPWWYGRVSIWFHQRDGAGIITLQMQCRFEFDTCLLFPPFKPEGACKFCSR